MNRLSNKHVLVTGASQGIGRELCRLLINSCRKLTLVSRRRHLLEQTYHELNGSNNKVNQNVSTGIEYVPFDVCDVAEIKKLCGKIYLGGDQIDVFINCAGGSHVYCPLDEMAHNDIDKIMDTNAKAPIHWLNELLPRVKENRIAAGSNKRGHILMLSSRSAERALPNLSAYAAAKAAVDKLLEALRLEYAGYGIIFTTVNPGSVDTAFTDGWKPQDQQKHKYMSMTVKEAAEAVYQLLQLEIAVNQFSFESVRQLRYEPGALPI